MYVPRDLLNLTKQFFGDIVIRVYDENTHESKIISLTQKTFYDDYLKQIQYVEILFINFEILDGFVFSTSVKKIWGIPKIKTKSLRGLFGNCDYTGTENDTGISKWDVSHVEDIGYIFNMSKYTGSPRNNICAWDTSSVKYMDWAFSYCVFDQDISNWVVSNVTHMACIFMGNKHFNRDIGKWDTSSVEVLQEAFRESNFNRYIGNWDISSLRTALAILCHSKFKDIDNTGVDRWVKPENYERKHMYLGLDTRREYSDSIIKNAIWDPSTLSKTSENFGEWNMLDTINTFKILRGEF